MLVLRSVFDCFTFSLSLSLPLSFFSVSIHDLASGDSGGDPLVLLKASSSRGLDLRTLHCSQLASQDWQLARTEWTHGKSGSHALAHFPSIGDAQPGAIAILRHLLLMQARPGKPGSRILEMHDHDDAEYLVGMGLMDASTYNAEIFTLSAKAMSELVFCGRVPMSQRLAIADVDTTVALEALDVYGLSLALEDAGWTWQQRHRDFQGVYEEGTSPLVWYSLGSHADKYYLLALLKARMLADTFGICQIPHRGTTELYQNLLVGKLAIEDALPAAPAPLVLIPETAFGVVPMPLEDAPPQCEAEAHLDLSGSDDEFLPAAIARRSSGDAGTGHDEGAPSVEEILDGRRWWGSFLFTKKSAGFQATCPWHRKNSVTGCKKAVTIKSHVTAEEAVLQLKFWCLAATTATSQYDHIREHLEPHPDGATMDKLLLESSLHTPPLSHTIKTDVELEAEALKRRGGRGRGTIAATRGGPPHSAQLDKGRGGRGAGTSRRKGTKCRR